MATGVEIPVPEQVRERLLTLGIDEKNIDNQMAIYVSLYQQALKGNVNACSQYLKLFANEEQQEEKTKDITKAVQQEEKSITQSLSCLPKEILNANKDFIHQLAFQCVTLKELSDDISKNGVKEKYKNGANQWGYKDRAEVKTYNNMFKNYQSAMKQLNDLLMQQGTNYDDEFDKF